MAEGLHITKPITPAEALAQSARLNEQKLSDAILEVNNYITANYARGESVIISNRGRTPETALRPDARIDCPTLWTLSDQLRKAFIDEFQAPGHWRVTYTSDYQGSFYEFVSRADEAAKAADIKH